MTNAERTMENYYKAVLRRIAREYMSAEEIERKSEKLYGLDYQSALEMSYDNIRGEAKHALKQTKRKIDSALEKVGK